MKNAGSEKIPRGIPVKERCDENEYHAAENSNIFNAYLAYERRRKMKLMSKRILSMLIVLMMCVNMFSVAAFAADGTEGTEIPQENPVAAVEEPAGETDPTEESQPTEES